MTALSESTATRIAKLIRLLSSDSDGEVANTVRLRSSGYSTLKG